MENGSCSCSLMEKEGFYFRDNLPTFLAQRHTSTPFPKCTSGMCWAELGGPGTPAALCWAELTLLCPPPRLTRFPSPRCGEQPWHLSGMCAASFPGSLDTIWPCLWNTWAHELCPHLLPHLHSCSEGESAPLWSSGCWGRKEDPRVFWVFISALLSFVHWLCLA